MRRRWRRCREDVPAYPSRSLMWRIEVRAWQPGSKAGSVLDEVYYATATECEEAAWHVGKMMQKQPPPFMPDLDLITYLEHSQKDRKKKRGRK